jgi:hypothetical protein
MRCLALLIVTAFLIAPLEAAPQPKNMETVTPEMALRWIYAYRSKPQPDRLPAFVRALGRSGALRDPESSGTYVGFLAGVLGANPAKAETLVMKSLPLGADSDWMLVRAIAYSGLPDWKRILQKAAPRMPTRKVMIDKYVSGALPTLEQIALPKDDPAFLDKVKGYFARSRMPKPAKLEPTPDVIDTLWGFYFATGDYRPIALLVAMLPWSKERDAVDKLTLGGMAKFTLASNAARDPALMNLLKLAAMRDKQAAPVLADVIAAAETTDTGRIRKDALAAIEELKRKGPGTRRDISWWGQIGQGAIALGCIGAAAAGVVAAGLPCVIGGAVSSGALYYWNGQQ